MELYYNGSYPYYIFNQAKNFVDSTYYTFNIYSYNYQHDSSTGVSASGYSAKVPNKMKPLVIYENTSSTSITVSFDNSVYDGGMPILYYNIYLTIKTVKMLFLRLLKVIKLKLLI